MVKTENIENHKKRLSTQSSPPYPPYAYSNVPVGTRSNGLSEVIRARCYCDRARLAVTKCSNRRGDGIGPLLL
jgi:hypothetical protein